MYGISKNGVLSPITKIGNDGIEKIMLTLHISKYGSELV